MCTVALSYSQLSTYRRCPKQYEFAYVQSVPRKMSAGESFGSSIHNTLRRFGNIELEITRSKDPKHQLMLFTEDHSHNLTLDTSLQTLLSLWRECFIAQGYDSTKDMEQKFESGAKALEYFYAWWEKIPRTVIAIEKGFSLSLGSNGPTLSGRFDRVERTPEGLSIIDFKSSKPRGQLLVDEDLQLSVYAMAAKELWNEKIHSLTLLSVTEEGIVQEVTRRTPEMLKRAQEEILELFQGMNESKFDAKPTKEKCWSCPYREMCSARMI